MKKPVFTGVCTALITPFLEGKTIDYDALDQLIEFQLSSGVNALCVCGTTGEASTLLPQERNELISFCVQRVNSRVPVIVGTGNNRTATAAEWTAQAEVLGADAVLVVTPYYNKASQEGLVQHYKSVAASTSLPVILYNVPSRTGISISSYTYQRLSEVENIVGTKEASGDISLAAKIRACCPEDFCIWSGNDDQALVLTALGGAGVISATANIMPDILSSMFSLAQNGRLKEAVSLQSQYLSLINLLFSDVNPIPVKAAMALMNMCDGSLRLPLCPISESGRALLRDELSRLGLL